MNKSMRLMLAKGVFLAAGVCAVAAPAFAEIVVVEPNMPPPAERVEVGTRPVRVDCRPLAARARGLSLGSGPLGGARPELALG